MIFVITLLTYVVSGAAPPVVAHFLLKIRFIGGIWTALLVGTIGSVTGGLISVLFLNLPDLIVLANIVDVVPPLVAGTVVTILFAFVSSSNR